MSGIFITGGSGSLGTALLKYLYDTYSDDITIYSRDEVKQAHLRKSYPDARYLLGDVRDYDRLMVAMRGHDKVIHAAAYKQVPSAEANVDEAIATNIMGSLNVARVAVLAGVEHVVGISTDKACQPINAYGETKALMEKLFQQADGWGDTFFNCVRYGNVLGSRGSVVPLFMEQIAQGTSYTLTDPDMTRFWMTLDDAVKLVMAALADKVDSVDEGAVLVPACRASTMLTLLDAVHTLWGSNKDPLNDDMYDVIGTRPGEKTHECLVHTNESMRAKNPTTALPYYQILPSTSDYVRDAEPFSYTSDAIAPMSRNELIAMLEDGERE